MESCLFCKMVSGQIKPQTVYESDQVLAFRDISPQAPVHILVIPKAHIATLNDTETSHIALLGEMMLTAKQVAKQEKIAESGFRIVMNCNADAGQSVFHIHMHIMGGRTLHWPPG